MTARAWAPIAAYVSVVLALSGLSVPGPPVNLFVLQDKVAHVIEFAGLGALVSRAVALEAPWAKPSARVSIAVLLALGAGAADELLQSYIPFRTADLADLGADAVGALIGGLIHVSLRPPQTRSAAPNADPEPTDADQDRRPR